MIAFIKLIIISVLTSLYVFPFEFTFLPGINMKMMMAVAGLAICAFDATVNMASTIPKGLLALFIAAASVSLLGLFSITYNNTPDTAYATYFVSMAVWLSAGYALCRIIKIVDGQVSVESLGKYLAIVCVFQCAAALLIDSIPVVQQIVDTYIQQDQTFLHKVHRIYGIGASLDTAGTRFSVCLIVIAHILIKEGQSYTNLEIFLYLAAFVFITIVGNIIARTTLIGIVVSLLYVACDHWIEFYYRQEKRFKILRIFLLSVAIAIPICVALYNNNESFHKLLRFGFEGFFSLAEKGRWEVSSNDKLEGMIVFPDNLKTWVIGDGYFENQRNDINYVGDATEGGFYMGTDVGYLRFIFYFGILGLLAFIAYFIVVSRLASQLNPEDYALSYFILIAGAIIWLKVATDLFLFFALLICVGYLRNDDVAEKKD